jgi:YidC/Oxa1 family membrane protein insertase
MKFDRNTVVGIALLGALFIGYFYFTNKEQQKYKVKKDEAARIEKAKQDSIALINRPKDDSIKRVTDSVSRIANAGVFKAATDTVAKEVAIENKLIRVTISSRGGQIKKVELKNYKGQDSNWVKMGASKFDKLSYKIKTGSGSDETANLNFSKIDSSSTSGNKTISFTLQGDSSSGGSSIIHEYTLKPEDYMIDFNVKMQGADKLLDGGVMNLTWQYAAAQQEADLAYERQNTQMGFVEDGSFDYHTIGRKSHKEFDEPVKWVGMRQRFFFGILSAKNNFSTGSKMEWDDSPNDSSNAVVQSTANMKVQVLAGSPAIAAFNIYYGPSDYKILKQYDMKFEKLVNLGQGIYAFVRPINKYLIMPIFDFLKGIAGSMGLAIALLTIFIKLITSPLLYKSYLSGAKMRVLRPDIAKLKEKFGDDKQGMMMEQMKLFREAGVNQLGGCLPALLQIPIFFALFSLFNSDIDLRGQNFLWANDLAAYDKFIEFGVNIPLLGSHLSLFNITAVVTSFLISVYSMRNAPEQDNPVLKYMPYIFPIFLLFFFNNLPSALTWYYTVSNVITLGLQYVIQNHIINHDKIMAQIEENRKKPKTKSKWQERMEQMQNQQKKMKETQQKPKR